MGAIADCVTVGSELQWQPWLFGAILNTVLLLIVWRIPKALLTPAGIIHAWFLGVIIWGSLGWSGYAVVGLYFIAGSPVARVGLAEKEAAGNAEKRTGARGPENVWGSAATTTLCALGVLGAIETNSYKFIPRLTLGYVASFATKLSDTFASEIGKAYGKRTFSMITLQPVAAGTEGAVSLEGTIAGIIGSILIAIAGWGVGLISLLGLVLCLIAAFIGTTPESFIGSTLQDSFNWMTNEVVNAINTLIGAIVAIGLGAIGGLV
ncbi:MAG: TIGR00297 family protein [Cyanophyceae cyanobacterium]